MDYKTELKRFYAQVFQRALDNCSFGSVHDSANPERASVLVERDGERAFVEVTVGTVINGFSCVRNPRRFPIPGLTVTSRSVMFHAWMQKNANLLLGSQCSDLLQIGLWKELVSRNAAA